MKPKPPDPQTAPAVKFRVNVIAPAESAPGGARFVPAGEPSPYRDIAEVPDHLRAFIVGDEEPEADEAEDAVRANYQLGVVYSVDESGRRGRAIARQVAQLEAQAEQEDWAVEQLSQPVASEVAAALEAQHDEHIGASKARARYAAEERDRAQEIAQKFIDEQDQEVNEL